MQTSTYRETDTFNAAWDHEEDDLGEDDVDVMERHAGRSRHAGPVVEPDIPGGSKLGFQYKPPGKPSSLMGWRVKVTFPTGPTLERRWHDGYIFQIQICKVGGKQEYRYRVYLPIDAGDEWLIGNELPEKALHRERHLEAAQKVEV